MHINARTAALEGINFLSSLSVNIAIYLIRCDLSSKRLSSYLSILCLTVCFLYQRLYNQGEDGAVAEERQWRFWLCAEGSQRWDVWINILLASHVLLLRLLVQSQQRRDVLFCRCLSSLQLRPLSKSSPPPRPSPLCSTWSPWMRVVLPGGLASGWEISS